MARWLRLWIRTRRQKNVRRLRGNVARDGDIHVSRAGRVSGDTPRRSPEGIDGWDIRRT